MGIRNSVNSLERRVKRIGRRYGVTLVRCPKPFGKVLVHGGYMLRDDDTRKIVFGNDGYEFSATLEEIEEFLAAQPKYRDDETSQA
ncbi:MAG TPA: hypothetical protein VFV70_02495 [Hyphomonadaceae bacterium]|nr:hypothetical protein [Hyphomonadaceae bacterium]